MSLSVNEIAVCHECKTPATQLRMVRKDTAHNDLFEDHSPGQDEVDSHISKTTTTIIYGCDDHIQEIEIALLNEYGFCFGHYEENRLAMRVFRGE